MSKKVKSSSAVAVSKLVPAASRKRVRNGKVTVEAAAPEENARARRQKKNARSNTEQDAEEAATIPNIVAEPVKTVAVKATRSKRRKIASPEPEPMEVVNEPDPEPVVVGKKAEAVKANVTRAKKQKVIASGTEPNVPATQPTAEKVPTGFVLTVGAGETGQLGLGEDIMERTRPSLINFPKPVKAICAGGMHTVLLTEDGLVYTFGCNDDGAIGRESSETVSEFLPELLELPSKIQQISAGDSHTAALTEDGCVYVCGTFRDTNGPIGLLKNSVREMRPLLVPMDEKIVQIASGADHLVLLTRDGHIFTCGNSEQGQLGRVVECFSSRGGRKGLAHLLVPAVVRMAKKKILFESVWAGACSTFARVRGTKDIYSCGLNNHNQLGIENVRNRLNVFTLQLVPSLSNRSWKHFACGDHHTLALTVEGEVYAFGRKEYGRLGLGPNTEDAAVPALLPAFTADPCKAVSCGVSSSFAVSESGKAYAWGLGNSNQLGQGSDEDVWEPTAMSGKQLENRKVIGISGGGQHAVLLVTENQPLDH